MHALSIAAAGQQGRPLVSEHKNHNRTTNRKANIVVYGSRNKNEELQRLESFFGTDEGFTGRRHHRHGNWVDEEVVDVQDSEPVEDIFTRPVDVSIAEEQPQQVLSQPYQSSADSNAISEALDKLSQLTLEQLTNLQIAAQHAVEALAELRGRGEAGIDAVQSKLSEAQTQLGPEVQNQAEKLSEAIKDQVEAFKFALDQVIHRQKQGVSSSSESSAAPVAAARSRPAKAASSAPQGAQEAPVGARFKAEIQQSIESLRSVTAEQLHNLQTAVVALEQDLSHRIENAKSALTQRTTPAAASAPVAQKQPVQAAARTPTAAAARPSWQEKFKERLPSIAVPQSIAQYSDVNQVKTAVTNNPWAVALGGGVVLLTSIGAVLRSRAQRKTSAEQEAINRARRRRALDRQRNRFKSALGSDSDAGVDSSVFAAVQKIQTITAAATAAASVDGVPFSDDDFDDDDALLSDPEAWDPEIKKQWQAFIRGSKLKDAAMWDAEDVDEGLPEIYVDLDKE